MVRVRLSRGGGKKRPYYHIVVVDQKAKRDGKCIERIGSYDPNLDSEKRISLKHDRLDHWISLGAQMTDRVRLLQKYSLDPNNLEKRQKIKNALLDKIKQKKLKTKEAEAAPADDTTAEAAPADDTTAEAAPADDTTAEAAPADDTTAEAAPADDTTAEAQTPEKDKV
jgi:small subunit ribosomal protein S16